MNKVGRNDPCPCGTGKKYKQCCLPGMSSEPSPTESLFQLALAHHRAGRLQQAQALYRQVLKLEPRHADALNLSGTAAGQMGNHTEAVDRINEALAIHPRDVGYRQNLGLALQALGRFDEAVANYQRALQLEPNHAAIHNSLGSALLALADVEPAIACFRRALALQPEYVEAWYNLGKALEAQPSFDEAAASYETALRLRPDYAEAHNNLGYVYQRQGRLDKAGKHFQRAFALHLNNVETYSNYLMFRQYTADYSPRESLADHRAFADRFETPLRVRWRRFDNTRDPARRLRIGFVSGDFRRHPVAYFLEGVLARLDRRQLHITLYSTNPQTDALTERLRRDCVWVDLTPYADDAAAQRIRDDGIDILVDLSGHTAHNRLLVFARKCAPVQVSWLGYWATTGLRAMDYFLCGPHEIPDAERDCFVERPWPLPHTRLCFTPPAAVVAVNALPALAGPGVTFGCFNNPIKMGDAVVALWARILREVSSSRLLLKAQLFADARECDNVRARFAAHGIESGQLLLDGFSSRDDYLAAYHRVDIALDPFPFTGATTSLEGVWMGVPFITRRGGALVGRQGESILRNLALSDWIAADEDSYVAIARQKARDLAGLAQLRGGLRARLLGSPLCDAPRFARDLEAALRGMWREYCERG